MSPEQQAALSETEHWQSAVARLQAENALLTAEVQRLRALHASACARIAAQAEILARRAEKLA